MMPILAVPVFLIVLTYLFGIGLAWAITDGASSWHKTATRRLCRVIGCTLWPILLIAFQVSLFYTVVGLLLDLPKQIYRYIKHGKE